MTLRKYLTRDVTAGCIECRKTWTQPNAQAVAASHARAHNHQTFANIALYWTYEPDTYTNYFPGLEPGQPTETTR